MTRKTLLVLTMISILCGTPLCTPTAHACVVIPQPPPIWVTFHTPASPFRAWVTVHGVGTFGVPLQAAEGCACGLNLQGFPEGTIFHGFVILDEETGEPLEQFSFSPSSTAGAAFGAAYFGGAQNGVGFFSTVSQSVPANLPVKIMLDVTIPEGASKQDLLDKMATANPLIAVDGADSQGNPSGDHPSVQPAGEVGEMAGPPISTPVGGPVGLAFLCLLLTTAAWWLFRPTT